MEGRPQRKSVPTRKIRERERKEGEALRQKCADTKQKEAEKEEKTSQKCADTKEIDREKRRSPQTKRR